MAINSFANPAPVQATQDAIIRMRGITKVFHTGGVETKALKGIDVDILQGQFVSVIGRSGSGKSTLVNMITGIDRPTSGSVEIGGTSTLRLPESEMAVWRGKNLGIVFQFFQLLPMLTLLENVMLPMDFCNIYPPASREERALALLHRVGLEGLAHMLPGAVAGGQQQCAAVARALANNPPILIADEPTGNLDTHTAEQVIGIFEELAAQGKTILIVTHDRSLAMRTHRRLLISDGELVHEALVDAFPNAPHSQLLQLSKQAVMVSLSPGQPLVESAGQGPTIYLVEAGQVSSIIREEIVTSPAGGLIDPSVLDHAAYAGEGGASLLALPRLETLSLLPPEPAAPTPLPLKPAARHSWFRRLRKVD